jgi:hypothetical protein
MKQLMLYTCEETPVREIGTSQSSHIFKILSLYEFSSFCRSAAELSAILGHDSASQGNFFSETSTFENENTTPYGNVENRLRNDAAQYPGRRYISQFLTCLYLLLTGLVKGHEPTRLPTEQLRHRMCD